jgi:hypothetical protein
LNTEKTAPDLNGLREVIGRGPRDGVLPSLGNLGKGMEDSMVEGIHRGADAQGTHPQKHPHPNRANRTHKPKMNGKRERDSYQQGGKCVHEDVAAKDAGSMPNPTRDREKTTVHRVVLLGAGCRLFYREEKHFSPAKGSRVLISRRSIFDPPPPTAMQRFLISLGSSLCLLTAKMGATPVPLFDGKTLEGWEGDIGQVWRVEESAVTAGTLEKRQPRNNFLATRRSFSNFDLSLKWRLQGTEGFVNGGVQFRSKRNPDGGHVSGYQADLGAGYDGALYDESRRNKVLQKPAKDVLERARKPLGEWNDYRIRAEGPRIQIWLNGVQTVDYTETDASIDLSGIIALQIHGGATLLVQYKDLVIEELGASGSTPK